MALKKRSTSTTAVGGPGSKSYFWLAQDYGNGQKRFHYVTADAATVVEVSGYFDDDELRAIMKPGDELVVFQVGAIDDTRTIQEDFGAGFADVSLHYVVQSDGSGINITADALAAGVVTYTS